PYSVRGGERRPVFPGLRETASDETFPARLAHRVDGRFDPVLLLFARSAGQLARSRSDRDAIRVAVRGCRSAAALPPGRREALSHVAVPDPGDRLARALAVRVHDRGPYGSDLRGRPSGGGPGVVRAFQPRYCERRIAS